MPHAQSEAAADKYEVKVYADADKIVKDNRHIDHGILDQLGSEDKDEDFNVQYIDDSNRTNYKNKETFRVRKSEDEDSTELQYKKRYPITNGDADTAIAQAKKDGFNTDEYEVEYGENGQTLSASNESETNSGYSLPNAAQSLDAMGIHETIDQLKTDMIFNNY
nr:hypothetical protein [Staphylococcus carnosus]